METLGGRASVEHATESPVPDAGSTLLKESDRRKASREAKALQGEGKTVSTEGEGPQDMLEGA